MAETIHTSGVRIAIHFDVHEPIGITELSRSLNAMAGLYKTALPKNAKGKASDEDVRLYIAEITDNCILVKLISVLEVAGVLSSDKEHLATFSKTVKHLSTVVSVLASIGAVGYLPELDDKLSKRETDYAAAVVEIVANNKNGTLNISFEESTEDADGSKTTTALSISHDTASNAMKGKRIVDDARKKTSEETLKEVQLSFIQANVGKEKGEEKAGFRATVNDVSPADFPVFMTYEDKKKIKKTMNNAEINPFTVSHTVDVEILMNKDGNPKSYKILKFHDE